VRDALGSGLRIAGGVASALQRLRSALAHRDGEQTRDFTFVIDVARAFVAAAESNERGEVFNVGSGEPASVNRLVELLGGPRVELPKRPGEPESTFADVARIESRLGWSAEVSFEEGVRRVLEQIDYWTEAPLWTPEKIEDATRDWFHYLDRSRDSQPSVERAAESTV